MTRMLAEAKKVLGTTSIVDTGNRSLEEVVALGARRRTLELEHKLSESIDDPDEERRRAWGLNPVYPVDQEERDRARAAHAGRAASPTAPTAATLTGSRRSPGNTASQSSPPGACPERIRGDRIRLLLTLWPDTPWVDRGREYRIGGLAGCRW
ncbi:MAG: hypothetical protein ACRDZ4_13960 [Egibacteraceae bacterium]